MPRSCEGRDRIDQNRRGESGWKGSTPKLRLRQRCTVPPAQPMVSGTSNITFPMRLPDCQAPSAEGSQELLCCSGSRRSGCQVGRVVVGLSMMRNLVSASRNGRDGLERLRLLEWCFFRKTHVDCFAPRRAAGTGKLYLLIKPWAWEWAGRLLGTQGKRRGAL